MDAKTLKIASITTSKSRYVLDNVRIEMSDKGEKFIATNGRDITFIYTNEPSQKKENEVKYIGREKIRNLKSGQPVDDNSFSKVDNFPNYKLALKTLNIKSEYEIKLDVNALYNAVTQAKKLGIDAINFEFNGIRKPLKIWGKDRSRNFTFVNYQFPKIEY